MPIKINYGQLEKLNRAFGVSDAESAVAVGRRQAAGLSELKIAHAAEKPRPAPSPRNSFRPTEGTSDPYGAGPSRGVGGGAEDHGGTRQSSPFADMSDDDLVDGALNHLGADDESELPRHERLGRAGAMLTEAARRLKPKAGSQHLARR